MKQPMFINRFLKTLAEYFTDNLVRYLQNQITELIVELDEARDEIGVLKAKVGGDLS